jgi:hypothetical protein
MNYGPRNALLLSRIDLHKAHAAHAELRKAAETCLAISQNAANKRDDVWQDRNLSAEGKRAKLAEMRAAQERLQADARRPISAALKAAEQQRAAATKPVELDRSPAAEARRIEMRTYLRALPVHEQLGRLMGANADPEAIEAALDRQPWLSGIPAVEYAKVQAAHAEQLQLNNPKLPAIEALEAVAGEADAVATVAGADLANIAADSGVAAA